MKKEAKEINNLVFQKLDGYSGIRLKNGKPLTFRPGINLLIGRNGSGKTNLLRLIQMIASSEDYLSGHVESSFFLEKAKGALNKSGSDSIDKKFGKPIIAKFRIKGKEGTVRIALRNVPEEFVLKNIVNDPANSYGGVAMICDSDKVSNQMIYGNAVLQSLRCQVI
jgi:energy-coupling factor transporter ATP-binding protein EcfA2